MNAVTVVWFGKDSACLHLSGDDVDVACPVKDSQGGQDPLTIHNHLPQPQLDEL